MLCICWNRKGYVFFLCHWIQQMLMLFLYGDSPRLLFFGIPENPQNMHVLTRLMSWGIWYYIVMALRKVEKRKKRRILSRRRFSCRAPPCCLKSPPDGSFTLDSAEKVLGCFARRTGLPLTQNWSTQSVALPDVIYGTVITRLS